LARQQARVATAGQLAAQSETLDDFDVGKANVLAAGAWQLDPDPLSLDAVADALQRPRQLVLRAHTAPVTGVAFADRGREVVTVGDDGNGYLWDVANGDEVGDPLAGYEVGPMPAPAVSGDGQTVATADGNYIYLWDTSGDSVGGSESADVSECLDDVAATAFSPDDSYLAVACQDSQYPSDKYGIGLNRLASANGLVSSAPGRELGNATTPFSAIAFSPDSHTLAAVNGDRTLLFTVSTGASGPVLSGDAAAVTSVEFSPDGRMLVTASKDGTARLWSAATGHQMAILRAGGGAVTAVAFSPDGSTVATASADGTARLWSTSSGAPIAMLTGHTEAIQAVAFDPREPIVVTASSDGTARVWDASTGAPIAVLRGDTGPVNAIAISPDGRTLATVSDDTTARLWDLTSAVPYTVLTVGSSAVTALAFNANGRTVAASGQDGSIRLWNSTGATVATYSGEEGPLLGVEFDSNGNVAATNGTTAEVWEPDSSAPPTPINFQPDGSEEIDPNPYQTAMANTCRCLSVAARGALVADANDGAFAVSPDGSRYADGNGLYKTATGQMVNSLGGEDAGKEWTSVAFSPDGTRLVVGNNDDTAWFYNGVTGNPIAQLGGNSPVLAAAFDPKGRTFATAEADGTIQLWNASSATPIGELTGSTSAVTRLAFSPDGETLASGSADGSVHLWNAITGSVIANLIGRTGPVSALAFDSDGVLAVGGKTGLVALWHVQVADLPSLCARIGGPVTRSEWTADVPGVAYEKVC
jgi:WD40 repeat protein